MSYTRWRRTGSIVATVALTASAGLVVDAHNNSAHAVPDLDSAKILHLSFDQPDDSASDQGTVSDVSQNEFNATVVGSGGKIESAKSGMGFTFTGEQYLDLGSDKALQPGDLSTAFWFNPGEEMSGEQLFAGHKCECNSPGWYLSSLDDDNPLVLSITDDDSVTGEFIVDVDRDEFFPANTWTHIGVTYDSDLRMVSFYRNGIKVSDTTTARSAGSVGPIGNSEVSKGIGWNGPNYKETSLKGQLDEFQLFAGALTPQQMRTVMAEAGEDVSDSAVIDADMDAITLESTLYSGTAPLPVVGPNGSQIEWVSSHGAVTVNDNGTITVEQPEAGQSDVAVTLSATFKLGSTEKTKDYSATVPALLTADVEELAQAIDLSDVTLEDPFLTQAQAAGSAYLLNLEPQKFLYNFYEVAGVDQPVGNSPYGK